MIQCRLNELPNRLKRHSGLSYCVVMKSEAQHEALLEMFSRIPSVAMVSQDGGLVGHLNAADNIKLPIHYRGVIEDRLVTYESFCRYGLIGKQHQQQLLLKFPEQMVTYEKRLVGFMRSLYVEPDLLIYDEIYDGLARREVELVARFDQLYHLYFPFRTSVLLSFENFNHPSGTHSQLIYLDEMPQ